MDMLGTSVYCFQTSGFYIDLVCGITPRMENQMDKNIKP